MKLLISVLALAVSGTFAFAADEQPAGAAPAAAPAAADAKPKRDPEAMFKRLDANADGGITLDEFKAGPAGKRNADKADENFKKRDKDSDGKLTLEEMKQGGGKKNKQ